MTILEELRQDCRILLERAMLGKTIFMFGEDGNGKHGKSEFPRYCKITGVGVSMQADDDDSPSDIHAVAQLRLEGYDSEIHGHAITDTNLRISLNMLMKDGAIDPACLDWADITLQDRHAIVLELDVGMLLDWA
jgi:hypothetical protein